MLEPFRGLIRASGFWSKEVVEILRQPRMIFSLVLGPFLILLIFGAGYHNTAPTFRTLFVAERGSVLYQHIEEYVSGLGSQFVYEGVTSDEKAALQRLHNGEVDLVAVAPTDALQKVQNNQQATFTIYQNELDPLLANWANYYAYAYVNEINRRVLANLLAQGKSDAAKLQAQIKTAHANIAAERAALQLGDTATAGQRQQDVKGNIDEIALAIGAGAGLLGQVQQMLGPSGGQSPSGEQPFNVMQDLAQSAASANGNQADVQSRMQAMNRMDQDLSQIEANLNKYLNTDPNILVSPFNNVVKTILPVEITPVSFFAPAVLGLLLQHLAITLAALSIVRERTLGTLELFRVSPLTASEALIGKYASYFLFTAIIGAILVGLMVFVLRIPMLGDWLNLAAVTAVVLFASLGIGFCISLISRTDSQAVQYTMLVLLASVFFSGFILTLDALLLPVRTISALLPTTYGIVLFRSIMLRGTTFDPLLVVVLLVWGILLYFVAWLMLRRLISRAQS